MAYFLQQLQAKVDQTRRRAMDKLFKSTYRHRHRESPSCICRNSVSVSDPVCDEALSSSCADLGCDDTYLGTREQLQGRLHAELAGGETA
ncbi:hypothetical protein TOPH_08159 [Tolypocladium ophioglossoides CBS 100239]|uniref:Uncharacterized protein n=1 Tax=Tolypocladium ophioglossoides (strain CBS 100239) TaxID=1163406 RepID=A0A0L0MZL2_TOLOC|nr:hypothetical protein TOPH_08159 [Tolypocladium ophioglossoides CBS 100239]